MSELVSLESVLQLELKETENIAVGENIAQLVCQIQEKVKSF